METDALHPRRTASTDAKKRKHQVDDDEAAYATCESDNDDDQENWTTKRSRRSRRAPPKRSAAATERLTKERYFVLLRPRGQKSMKDIPRKVLSDVLDQLSSQADLNAYVSTKLDVRSNAITVTLYDKIHAERVSQLTHIQLNGSPFEIEAQLLHPRGTSRGVIQVDPSDTDVELKQHLTCETATILDVKRMGRSHFALVTFDTTHAPKIVRNYKELCKVAPYIPRTLVCYRCHRVGHLQRHCPNEGVCKTCGRTHAEGACVPSATFCTLCKEVGHLATDLKCPERERRLQRNKERVKRKSRSRSRKRTINTQLNDLNEFPPLPAPATAGTAVRGVSPGPVKTVSFKAPPRGNQPDIGATKNDSVKSKKKKATSAELRQRIQDLQRELDCLKLELRDNEEAEKEEACQRQRQAEEQRRRRQTLLAQRRRQSQSPASIRLSTPVTQATPDASGIKSEIEEIVIKTLRTQLPTLMAEYCQLTQLTPPTGPASTASSIQHGFE